MDSQTDSQVELSSAAKSLMKPTSSFGTTSTGTSPLGQPANVFSLGGTRPLGISSPPSYRSSSFSFSDKNLAPERWHPENTLMVSYHTRLRSFDCWPKQLVQVPEQLVQSGFYYTGRGDLTRCFFCGIGVHSWETFDNINFEHKRHSPRCKYVDMACDI